jgi:hypothetical protein
VSARNPWQELARQRKALRLADEITRLAESKLGARATPTVILDVLSRATREHWARWAVLAAVKPPSAETQHEVMAIFARRAGVAA